MPIREVDLAEPVVVEHPKAFVTEVRLCEGPEGEWIAKVSGQVPQPDGTLHTQSARIDLNAQDRAVVDALLDSAAQNWLAAITPEAS